MDQNNFLESAPGALGQCPPAGDPAYTEGLASGDFCVQLTILDGGPNDADGIINGLIKDPGGIVTEFEPDTGGSPAPAPAPEPIKTGTKGGGGGVMWMLLALISLILVARVLSKQVRRTLPAAALLIACYLVPSGFTEAQAADIPKDNRYGYIAVGAGYTSLDPDTNQSGLSVSDNNDVGYKLQLGYRWNDQWALEVFGTDLGEASLDPAGQVEYDVWVIGVLFHLISASPHSNFDFYLKGGWAQLDTDADVAFEQQHDNQFFIGAGLDHPINDRWHVRAELVHYDEDVALFSLSLVLRFGGS